MVCTRVGTCLGVVCRYVRRRLPRHSVFYDLSDTEHVEFISVKDSAVTDGQDRDLVQYDEERSFTAEQWKVSICYCVSLLEFSHLSLGT